MQQGVYSTREFGPRERSFRSTKIWGAGCRDLYQVRRDIYPVCVCVGGGVIVVWYVGLHFVSKKTEILDKSSKTIDILLVLFEPKWNPNEKSQWGLSHFLPFPQTPAGWPRIWAAQLPGMWRRYCALGYSVYSVQPSIPSMHCYWLEESKISWSSSNWDYIRWCALY